MTTEAIINRTRMIQTEINVYKQDIAQISYKIKDKQESIKDNTEKIKLNKTLPYLVRTSKHRHSNVMKLIAALALAARVQVRREATPPPRPRANAGLMPPRSSAGAGTDIAGSTDGSNRF